MTRTYGKWSSVENQAGIDGHKVARHILDNNQLGDVRLEVSEGMLAVAAHEVGHAIQDRVDYAPLKLKAVMMPVAAMGNRFGLILTLAAAFIGSGILMNIGLIMLLLGMLMPILTLPIEFDASKRALEELTKYNFVTEQEYAGAKSMLFAAALTYVAGAASSIAILGLLAMRFLKR